MDVKAIIKAGLNMGELVSMAYLNDLTDEELMRRPHPECNHLNWQVGHLISTEHEMMSKVPGVTMPGLPAGFKEKYTKESAASDEASDFCTKEELMATYKQQRAATLEALENVSESDLQKASGIDYAPTMADLFRMQGEHWLMHCGQWVIIRREAGKPVVI